MSPYLRSCSATGILFGQWILLHALSGIPIPIFNVHAYLFNIGPDHLDSAAMLHDYDI